MERFRYGEPTMAHGRFREIGGDADQNVEQSVDKIGFCDHWQKIIETLETLHTKLTRPNRSMVFREVSIPEVFNSSMRGTRNTDF